jgi:hypothetical protein
VAHHSFSEGLQWPLRTRLASATTSARGVTFARSTSPFTSRRPCSKVLQLAGAGYENRLILGTDTVTSGYVGVAAEALTTTATHNAVTDHVPVWLATPDAEFIGRTVADDTVDFTDIGVNVELELDATYSITRVQTDGTTYEVVRVLQYLNPVTKNVQATEGDTSVWCVFKFIPGASIYIPTILA